MQVLAVLLVISNLIGLKYTNFLDITIGVDFITFPFTFLCTLLIINMGGKKSAYRSVLAVCIIQLLITISYVIATSLGSQSLMPDGAAYVNQVFKVNELNIIASVLAFSASHCLLIYVYDNFTRYNKELYGLFIGLLGALVLNSIIYLGISLHMYELMYIVNMILSNIIVDIVMIIIIVILVYILKEKDEKVVTFKQEENVKSSDLGTEEIMENKKTPTKKKNTGNKNTKKTNNNYRKNTTNNKTNKIKQVKSRKDNK